MKARRQHVLEESADELEAQIGPPRPMSLSR
jgi:hypothetical protein